tara:strand:+ start:1939 stop:2766 length:828 start_codon:yes stop_codon:yes gene_type:complete
MVTTDYEGHFVFLDLSSRSPITDRTDTTTMKNFDTNRIALKCETVGISTTKDVMAMPIPLSGIFTGEANTQPIDLGIASKTITLGGIITEQQISKQFKPDDLPKDKVDSTVDVGVADRTYTDVDGKHVIVNMTAQEICQLIHSYVDSSFAQVQQNLNNLIIFIPSRVGNDFLYHETDAAGDDVTDVDGSAIGKNTPVDQCPLVPFNYGVRSGDGFSLDAFGSFGGSSFPKPLGDTTKYNKLEAIAGFIRSFDTTFVGGQPYVEFNMSFEVARGLI